MSSLLFGMLLPALTVYLMHGVADCSGLVASLAAAAVAASSSSAAASHAAQAGNSPAHLAQHELALGRPGELDAPYELAASLTASNPNEMAEQQQSELEQQIANQQNQGSDTGAEGSQVSDSVVHHQRSPEQVAMEAEMGAAEVFEPERTGGDQHQAAGQEQPIALPSGGNDEDSTGQPLEEPMAHLHHHHHHHHHLHPGNLSAPDRSVEEQMMNTLPSSYKLTNSSQDDESFLAAKLPSQYDAVLRLPPEGYYDDYFKPPAASSNVALQISSSHASSAAPMAAGHEGESEPEPDSESDTYSESDADSEPQVAPGGELGAAPTMGQMNGEHFEIPDGELQANTSHLTPGSGQAHEQHLPGGGNNYGPLNMSLQANEGFDYTKQFYMNQQPLKQHESVADQSVEFIAPNRNQSNHFRTKANQMSASGSLKYELQGGGGGYEPDESYNQGNATANQSVGGMRFGGQSAGSVRNSTASEGPMAMGGHMPPQANYGSEDNLKIIIANTNGSSSPTDPINEKEIHYTSEGRNITRLAGNSPRNTFVNKDMNEFPPADQQQQQQQQQQQLQQQNQRLPPSGSDELGRQHDLNGGYAPHKINGRAYQPAQLPPPPPPLPQPRPPPPLARPRVRPGELNENERRAGGGAGEEPEQEPDELRRAQVDSVYGRYSSHGGDRGRSRPSYKQQMTANSEPSGKLEEHSQTRSQQDEHQEQQQQQQQQQRGPSRASVYTNGQQVARHRQAQRDNRYQDQQQQQQEERGRSRTQRHYNNNDDYHRHSNRYSKEPSNRRPQVTQANFNPKDLITNAPTSAPAAGESPLESIAELPGKVKRLRQNQPDKNELMNELLTALDRVKVAIYKLQPLTAKMNAIYRKSVTSNTRDIIMDNHKGTYAKRYPPGDYDDTYDRMHPSEILDRAAAQRSAANSRDGRQQSKPMETSESTANAVYLPAPKELLERLGQNHSLAGGRAANASAAPEPTLGLTLKEFGGEIVATGIGRRLGDGRVNGQLNVTGGDGDESARHTKATEIKPSSKFSARSTASRWPDYLEAPSFMRANLENEDESQQSPLFGYRITIFRPESDETLDEESSPGAADDGPAPSSSEWAGRYPRHSDERSSVIVLNGGFMGRNNGGPEAALLEDESMVTSESSIVESAQAPGQEQDRPGGGSGNSQLAAAASLQMAATSQRHKQFAGQVQPGGAQTKTPEAGEAGEEEEEEDEGESSDSDAPGGQAADSSLSTTSSGEPGIEASESKKKAEKWSKEKKSNEESKEEKKEAKGQGKKKKEHSKKSHAKKKKHEEESKKKKEYKKIKHNKGIVSKEKKSMKRDKHIKAHDRGAAKEKALKERTQIEFFEREQIVDDEFEKGKKSTVKAGWQTGHESKKSMKESSGHKSHDSSHEPMSASGSHYVSHADKQQLDMAASEHSGSKAHKEGEKGSGLHLAASSAKKSNKFEKKDMEAKGKKFKGWREKGYKIITETEFIDRGSLHDSAYKKRDKGAAHHQKYKKQAASSEGHHGSMHEHHKKSHKNEEKKEKSHEKKEKHLKKSEKGKESGEEASKEKKEHGIEKTEGSKHDKSMMANNLDPKVSDAEDSDEAAHQGGEEGGEGVSRNENENLHPQGEESQRRRRRHRQRQHDDESAERLEGRESGRVERLRKQPPGGAHVRNSNRPQSMVASSSTFRPVTFVTNTHLETPEQAAAFEVRQRQQQQTATLARLLRANHHHESEPLLFTPINTNSRPRGANGSSPSIRGTTNGNNNNNKAINNTISLVSSQNRPGRAPSNNNNNNSSALHQALEFLGGARFTHLGQEQANMSESSRRSDEPSPKQRQSAASMQIPLPNRSSMAASNLSSLASDKANATIFDIVDNFTGRQINKTKIGTYELDHADHLHATRLLGAPSASAPSSSGQVAASKATPTINGSAIGLLAKFLAPTASPGGQTRGQSTTTSTTSRPKQISLVTTSSLGGQVTARDISDEAFLVSLLQRAAQQQQQAQVQPLGQANYRPANHLAPDGSSAKGAGRSSSAGGAPTARFITAEQAEAAAQFLHFVHRTNQQQQASQHQHHRSAVTNPMMDPLANSLSAAFHHNPANFLQPVTATQAHTNPFQSPLGATSYLQQMSFAPSSSGPSAFSAQQFLDYESQEAPIAFTA